MIEKVVDGNWCIEQLKEAIRIPSPTGNEERLADWVGSILKRFGFEVDFQEVDRERKNVVGRRAFGRKGPSILVGGHLDTVQAAGDWSRDPLIPVVENGNLFGLGACDMKAGLVALLAAIEAIDRSRALSRGELLFAGLVDEEALSLGAKAFVKSPLKADMALLAEPHDEEIVIGGPGKVLFEIHLQGKGGHASHPQSGINAIGEAAKLINRLDQLPRAKHDIMGTGTHCVLRIQGGSETYSLSIPEFCSFLWSRHLVPPETADQVALDLEHLGSIIGLKGKLTVRRKDPYYPPYVVARDEIIVRSLQQAYHEETSKLLTVGFGKSVSDANLLVADKGIPTVLFGPRGGNIHSGDEYVSIDSMIRAARIYTRVFEALLG